MGQYDDGVYHAKKMVTDLILSLVSNDERKHRYAVEQLPGAIDSLNRAWDEPTNCLVRHRTERDEQISRLMSELAEAKKDQ